MEGISGIRYGGGKLDLRRLFIKLCAWLQGKTAVILDDDPELCAQILQSSIRKGTFVENIFAIPAWSPVYSIESEDGERWKDLAQNCAKVLRGLNWKERLPDLVGKYAYDLVQKLNSDSKLILDSEEISRFTLRILFELLFEEVISTDIEEVFYQASLEWRKEIALKGKGDVRVKSQFCFLLSEIVGRSKYREGLGYCPNDPMLWLSIFAQPFIISPQINVSDIMVAAFGLLHGKVGRFAIARQRALQKDSDYLNAVLMEALRLQHPFPIFERELTKNMEIKRKVYQPGTQVFIMLDQFKQNQDFNPQMWMEKEILNPYKGLVFGSGQRMCLGKTLAVELLKEMFGIFLIYVPHEKIKPEVKHLYSGRDNDNKQSPLASFYQFYCFALALWKSYKLGRTN